jgi:hypothetical protein
LHGKKSRTDKVDPKNRNSRINVIQMSNHQFMAAVVGIRPVCSSIRIFAKKVRQELGLWQAHVFESKKDYSINRGESS